MTSPLRVDLVDLSHHNRNPQLGVAKDAGLKGVYQKATEGSGLVDPTYHMRRLAARAVKLPFGAYHFARPDGGDAVKEAQAFLKFAQPLPGDLIPMLDLEDAGKLSKAALTKWAGDFMREVKKALGVVPILYTNFDLNPGFGLEANGGALLWMARYNNTNTPPQVAKPWKQIDIWQFSNGQYGVPDHFDGVGHVDLNHFRTGLKIGDIRIPQPEPVVERTGWFRVVTQNVKSLPRMPQDDVVSDVQLTAQQAGIIGWQEMGPARYKKAVDQLDKDVWASYFAHHDRTDYDSPISFRTSAWELVDAGAFLFQKATAKISRDRYFTWVVLLNKNIGVEVLVTNKHYIAGAWNDADKPAKDERPGIWRAGRDMEVQFLQQWIHDHPFMPIINLGDYNATHKVMAKEYPATIHNRPVNYQVGERAIDQIMLINGRGAEFIVDDEDGELLLGRNSDHQGRRSTQKLKVTK